MAYLHTHCVHSMHINVGCLYGHFPRVLLAFYVECLPTWRAVLFWMIQSPGRGPSSLPLEETPQYLMWGNVHKEATRRLLQQRWRWRGDRGSSTRMTPFVNVMNRKHAGLKACVSLKQIRFVLGGEMTLQLEEKVEEWQWLLNKSVSQYVFVLWNEA